MSDPAPPRSSPATPAYGAGAPPGGPAAAPTSEVSGAWLSVGLAVVLNLVTLVGVVALGWPAGNVFALFWCENVVLGLVSVVRVASAQALDRPRTGRSGLRFYAGDAEITPPGSPGLAALFFVFHYGLFCLVHLGFTVLVVLAIDHRLSWFFLGLPVALLLARYTVELVRTWFGPGGLRDQTSPREAMVAPYPRVVVLQLSVMLAFGLLLFRRVGVLPGDPTSSDAVTHVLDHVLGALPLSWRQPGVVAVTALLLIKTVADVVTTRRALRAR